MRRVMHLGLVVGLVLALTACRTQEQQTTARSVALADARFQQLLASHPYTVTRLAPREQPTLSLDRATVEITFAQPVPWSDWTADACGTVQDQPFTGIRWQVDLEAKRILAVSQILADGTSCLSR